MNKYLIIICFILQCFCEIDFDENGKNFFHAASEKIFYKDFLQSYNYINKYDVSPKKIKQASLAYITPWNSRGYDIAKKFAMKFTHISPVWLQITADNKYSIKGIHDIDNGWIKALRVENFEINILPRIIFENWAEKDFQNLLRSEKLIMLCIRSLTDVIKKYNFDGLVLELWQQHYGTSQNELIQFIKHISAAVHEIGRQLILVIPPPVYQGNYIGKFLNTHFDALSADVDYFSLMTYDYSNSFRPGPNSPIYWVRECVNLLVPQQNNSTHREKLLVGLNFYGYDYIPNRNEGKPVIGHEFVNIIDAYHPKFQWDKQSAEHLVNYRDSYGNEHMVYYPSLMSIARRVSLAEELGTGISIWEIGQGLDSFYEQL